MKASLESRHPRKPVVPPPSAKEEREMGDYVLRWNEEENLVLSRNNGTEAEAR